MARVGAICVALAPAGELPCQQPPADQPTAKQRAITLLKFAPYLQRTARRPANGKQPVCIGVVGTDDVVTAAKRLLPHKRIGGRAVKVMTIAVERAQRTQHGQSCDIIYLARSLDDATVRAIIKSHRTSATALVCERPGFAQDGGGVQLFVAGKDRNALRFEINAEAFTRQGLRASPQLRKLSREAPRR